MWTRLVALLVGVIVRSAVNLTDVPQWLLALGGMAGLTGGAISVFQSRAARRRVDAEAEKFNADAEKLNADADFVLTQRANTVNQMALGLLAPMEHRIIELTAEVTRLDYQVRGLTTHLRLAHDLLTAHNIEIPVWSDPTRDSLPSRDVHDRGW
jgi:hypothetical protein